MRSLLMLLASASLGTGDLICTDYIPKNWTSSTAEIYIHSGDEVGSTFDRPDLLPTYAGVGNPWKLRFKYNAGAKFKLKSCNSTSLARSAFTQSSCSHGGCYISYYDYIQVINPYTGSCLTASDWDTDATDLKFVKCIGDALNTSQLWLANQYVNYAPGYSSIRNYGAVTFDPVQRGLWPRIDSPFFAWYISKQDNKTLKVVHYDYTQRGVFMNLEQI